MSKSKHSSKDISTGTDSIAEADEQKTKQAAKKAMTHIANEMAPETLVVDNPPPKPNYPQYRVKPGEAIALDDIDPDTSEHYQKKKDVAEELEVQCQRLQNLQER